MARVNEASAGRQVQSTETAKQPDKTGTEGKKDCNGASCYSKVQAPQKWQAARPADRGILLADAGDIYGEMGEMESEPKVEKRSAPAKVQEDKEKPPTPHQIINYGIEEIQKKNVKLATDLLVYGFTELLKQEPAPSMDTIKYEVNRVMNAILGTPGLTGSLRVVPPQVIERQQIHAIVEVKLRLKA